MSIPIGVRPEREPRGLVVPSLQVRADQLGQADLGGKHGVTGHKVTPEGRPVGPTEGDVGVHEELAVAP